MQSANITCLILILSFVVIYGQPGLEFHAGHRYDVLKADSVINHSNLLIPLHFDIIIISIISKHL